MLSRPLIRAIKASSDQVIEYELELLGEFDKSADALMSCLSYDGLGIAKIVNEERYQGGHFRQQLSGEFLQLGHQVIHELIDLQQYVDLGFGYSQTGKQSPKNRLQVRALSCTTWCLAKNVNGVCVGHSFLQVVDSFHLALS